MTCDISRFLRSAGTWLRVGGISRTSFGFVVVGRSGRLHSRIIAHFDGPTHTDPFIAVLLLASSLTQKAMTLIDMDDTMFENRNEEELGAIEEEFADEKELLQEKRMSYQSNRSDKSSGSNNSSNTKFQYPATLDEAGGGGVARLAGGGMRFSKKPKKKIEKNRDFKDVEETGKWGAVSRKEIICVGSSLALVVVGVVVGLIFILTGGGQEDEQNVLAPPPPIEIEKTYLNKQEHYDDLMTKINKHAAVADVILQSFPDSVDDLGDETVYVKAANWLIFSDPTPVK